MIKEKGLTDKKEINHFKVNTNIYEKNKIGKPSGYFRSLCIIDSKPKGSGNLTTSLEVFFF